MPALPTTLPTAGNTRVSDNTYLTIATGATGTQTVALDNMPADFSTMTAASWTIEYNQTGRVDDTEALAVRITNGATILAAADAGGTFVDVNTNVTNTTDTTAGPTAFAYVNTSALKPVWDGASVEIRQTHSSFMGNDDASIRVDYFALTGTYEAPLAADQNAFRIRQGDTNDGSIALNAAFAGGDPALNTNATILAETPFRIRFEIEESSGGSGILIPEIKYRRNGGSWVQPGRYPDDPSTATSVSAVQLIDSYPVNIDGVATTQVIGVGGTFIAGIGSDDNDNAASGISLTANSKTEVEFNLLIRKLTMTSGGTPGENANGDTFEFRVTNNGFDLTTYTNTPTITLSTVGKIGGTYPESSSRCGPIKDDNGNLYWLQEYFEADPQLVMLKSTDGGDTWVGQDVANRPTTEDMESLSMAYDGSTGIIHILHQPGSGVFYHRFHASDHASTPDTWAIKDETVIATTTFTDQCCSIEPRSDGTVVAFYTNGGTTTSQDVVYKIRSTGGTWGTEVSTDTQATTFFNGVSTVRNTANDTIHLFYGDITNAILYHRTLNSSDTLSARQSIATNVGSSLDERWPVIPPVLYDDSGTESVWVIFIDDSDQHLRCRELRNGTPQTETDATTEACRTGRLASRQPQADLVRDPTNNTLYLVFVAGPADTTNKLDLFIKSKPHGGAWGSRTLLREDPLSGTVGANDQAFGIDFVRAQLFTHSSGNGSARVVGMVLDDRPSYTPETFTHAGFTGGGVYQEYVVAAGGNDVNGNKANETDTANTGSVLAVINGNKANETDVANAGITTIAVNGNTANESDVANSGTIISSVTGNKADETDTANAGSVALTVSGNQATESDIANTGQFTMTVSGAQAAETDVSNTGTISVAINGGTTNETDTANSGTVVTGIIVFGNQATESYTANSGQIIAVVNGNQSTEVDTPVAGSPAITYIGVTVFESDLAPPGSIDTSISGQTSSENDFVNVGQASAAISGTTANEADTANTGFISANIIVQGNTANEVDIAQGADSSIVSGQKANETDVAYSGAIHATSNGTTVTETDSANPGTTSVNVLGAVASEIDTSSTGTASLTHGGQQVSEVNTANQGTPNLTVFGQTATESDASNSGTSETGYIISGNKAEELDTVNSGIVSAGIIVHGAFITETSSAPTGSITVVVQGNIATEIDVANARLAQRYRVLLPPYRIIEIGPPYRVLEL